MFSKGSSFCAVAILSCAGLSASAAIIKTSKHASTSNHTIATTTSGQRSILMTVDPLNVASFQLEVSFEGDKAEFVGIEGLNGYIIDTDYEVATEGSFGQIFAIHGYYPGFNDRQVELAGGVTEAAAAVAIAPPAGEVDIFQLTFNDLAPDQDKTFSVFANFDDYIRSYDPDTGLFSDAVGPYNQATDEGVDPAFSTVAAVSAVPLPGGLAMGGIGGLGVLAGTIRRRRRA